MSIEHLFDGLDLEEDTTPTPTPAPEPVQETETPEETETEEVTTPAPAPEQKPITMETLDHFYSKQKKMEQYEAELTQYKQKEAQARQEAALKQAEADKMPDPLYNPEEYQKWVIRQQNKTNQSFEQRLEQIQTQMAVENVELNLNRSLTSAEEKYGKNTLLEAEKWAVGIIHQAPREALSLLKSNPSWDYIVEQYIKARDQMEYNKDPNAFLERKLQERQMASNVEPSQVQTPAPKKPKASINRLTSSTSDPKKEVPAFLQGL